jgi:NAD(P)-dependent dehydrogenase (short-subunit alcohol dehydrogenase family)
VQELTGKVAVVTGAASGIGRGIAESFLAGGAKVVLADLEAPRLEQTRAELAKEGDVIAVETDVSKFEQVEALAARATEHFGRVHILCNNAGIGVGGGSTWESTLDDWNWILGVNLMGVVHGIKAFVPDMKAHGEASAIVNTASMAGLTVAGGNALYAVTKHAVVALSEALSNEFSRLAPHIQSHVLCPGFVSTDILESERSRPTDLGDATPSVTTPESEIFRRAFSSMVEGGMPPREVGDLVSQSILDGTFYILPHPWHEMIETRMRNILDGKAPVMTMPPGFGQMIQSALSAPIKS